MKILLIIFVLLLAILVVLGFVVLSGIVKCAEAQDESREDDLPRPLS